MKLNKQRPLTSSLWVFNLRSEGARATEDAAAAAATRILPKTRELIVVFWASEIETEEVHNSNPK